MDPLAELVARHAPELVGAVAARDEVPPQWRVDAEVARTLAEIWVAGPPHEPAVLRSRRRLSAGDGDLVDLGAPAVTDSAHLGPERLDRLTAAVRRHVTHLGQAPRRRRVLIACAVAVAMMAVVVGGVRGLPRESPAAEQQSAPSLSPPPSDWPQPVRTASMCRDDCSRERARVSWSEFSDWGARVRRAVFRHLDPGDELLGGPQWHPMLTGMQTGSYGRSATAEFGLALLADDAVLRPDRPTSAPQLGVTVIAAERRWMVPHCGAELSGGCTERLMPGGHVVWHDSTATVTEVVHRVEHADRRDWVYVRVEAAAPGLVALDQVLQLAIDSSLQL